MEHPEGGKVEMTGVHFGAKAFYSCEDEFHVTGLKQRVCQPDGTWSGSDTTCQENSK